MPYKNKVVLAYVGVGAIWVAGLAVTWIVSGQLGKTVGRLCMAGSEKLLSYAKI
jgi:hypothetical protein